MYGFIAGPWFDEEEGLVVELDVDDGEEEEGTEESDLESACFAIGEDMVMRSFGGWVGGAGNVVRQNV
jgi:hypothetical protein